MFRYNSYYHIKWLSLKQSNESYSIWKNEKSTNTARTKLLLCPIICSLAMSRPAMVSGTTGHPMLHQVAHMDIAAPMAIHTAIPHSVSHLLTSKPSLELVADVLVFKLHHLPTFDFEVFLLTSACELPFCLGG